MTFCLKAGLECSDYWLSERNNIWPEANHVSIISDSSVGNLA